MSNNIFTDFKLIRSIYLLQIYGTMELQLCVKLLIQTNPDLFNY